MDEYLSEKEQVEALRQWWRENGRFIVTGLILGAAILIGWRQWTSYQINHATEASAIYTRLLGAVQTGDRELALELGDQLIADYKKTPYVDQAALALAQLHVNSSEYDQAAEQLRRAIDDTTDRELARVARLRLARVRLQQQRYDDALAALQDPDPGAFAPRYHETRGDIRLAMGDIEAARAQYEAALATDLPGIVDRNLLQMKLDHLAAESPPLGADTGAADSSPE